MKQTKNILKKSELEKEIFGNAKRAFQSSLIVLIPLTLVWGLIFSFPFFGILSGLKGMKVGLLSILLLGADLFLMVFPLLAIGMCWYRYAEIKGILKRGTWAVETDSLSYKVDGETSHTFSPRHRYHVDRVFYFCRYGRYVVSGNVHFEMAGNGDTFYVLVLRHRFPQFLTRLPIFPSQVEELFCAWPTTMYEYREDE